MQTKTFLEKLKTAIIIKFYAIVFEMICLLCTVTEQMYVFTTMEAEGEIWDPVKLAWAIPSPVPTAHLIQ